MQRIDKTNLYILIDLKEISLLCHGVRKGANSSHTEVYNRPTAFGRNKYKYHQIKQWTIIEFMHNTARDVYPGIAFLDLTLTSWIGWSVLLSKECSFTCLQVTMGTNPLALAAPGKGDDSFVLDMATSAVALGKVLLHHICFYTILSDYFSCSLKTVRQVFNACIIFQIWEPSQGILCLLLIGEMMC